MTTVDLLLYYTLYQPRVGMIVVKLPISKRMKLRILNWQFRGLAGIAMKKLKEKQA